MKKKVYISGAIAHYGMEERRATFEAAALRLKEQGFEPVNPFENGVPDDAHWMAHMKADIALLVGCDYIYMLNGWELSKGAKLEFDVASSCGIKVMFEGQKSSREYVCCICGEIHSGYGHSPHPVKHGGECCPECNKQVLETRSKLAKGRSMELRLKFEQCGKTSGDETTPYNVSLNKICTLRELIDTVLKRKEWGYIGVKCVGSIFGNPSCEYKKDKIIKSNFTDDYLDRVVDTVFASGGWTRMDYKVTLK